MLNLFYAAQPEMVDSHEAQRENHSGCNLRPSQANFGRRSAFQRNRAARGQAAFPPELVEGAQAGELTSFTTP